MEMKGINHVNIAVSDLDKSQKFYSEVFGMKEAYRIPQFRFLTCGKDLLTLQIGEPINAESNHFGFDVNNKDELNKWKDWLKEKNISIDSFRVNKGSAGIYFRDPDGNRIEIYFVEGN